MNRKYLTIFAFYLFTLVLSSSPYAEQQHWKAWSQLLNQAVTDKGFVDYNMIQQGEQLDNIIKTIETTAPTSLQTIEQQLTFYINSYNALVIYTIINGKSPSHFFGRFSFFRNSYYTVAGTSMNLHELEHDVIRPLQEPRIHFALVCASYSCPKLLNSVYRAEDINQQLELAAKAFINNSQKNHFDQTKKIAYISKIFDWFDEDFSSEEMGLLDYIAQYVDDEKLAIALRQQTFTIRFNNYDWSLNGQYEE